MTEAQFFEHSSASEQSKRWSMSPQWRNAVDVSFKLSTCDLPRFYLTLLLCLGDSY